MGTSSSFSAPPSWGGLKAHVTRSAGAGTGAGAARGMVSKYISRNGGPSGMAARGAGGGGGPAGRQAAKTFAGFSSRVAEVGLPQALQEIGLGHLVGQPVSAVAWGLIDHFCGPGSTFDQVDARNAMSRLTARLLEQAETAEQVEEILGGIVREDRLGPVLLDYFAYLVYEEFMRSFYEQVLQSHGEMRAESLANDIRDFLVKAVENLAIDVDMKTVDWSGREGRQAARRLMQQALRVFGS